MSENICGLVCGVGVTPYEELPVNPVIFTEVAIAETVVIPEVKPDIEQLVCITAEAEIISSRLIVTSVGTSNEGQHLTGYKLVLEIKLRQKIKYVADEPTQSVHAAHFEKVITSVFVVVPPVIGTMPIETLFNQGRLIITPYIEDIYGELRDKRTIFKNIIILVNVTAV